MQIPRAFILRAHFGVGKDPDGKPLKYVPCKWPRGKCIICLEHFSVESLTTFINHLAGHKEDMARIGNEQLRELFCKHFNIKDVDTLCDDPEKQCKFQKLLAKYQSDSVTTMFNNDKTSKPMAYPISLSRCGPKALSLMYEHVMKVAVEFGSTPTSTQKQSLIGLIQVC